MKHFQGDKQLLNYLFICFFATTHYISLFYYTYVCMYVYPSYSLLKIVNLFMMFFTLVTSQIRIQT